MYRILCVQCISVYMYIVCICMCVSLLFSIRIEGDIPGFELSISDEQVVTVLKIVTSLQLPPPSLANTTTYYDEIPVPCVCVVCCFFCCHGNGCCLAFLVFCVKKQNWVCFYDRCLLVESRKLYIFMYMYMYM